mgnify:CR=1 FL=1
MEREINPFELIESIARTEKIVVIPIILGGFSSKSCSSLSIFVVLFTILTTGG